MIIGEPLVPPSLAAAPSPMPEDEVSSVAQTVARRIVADSQKIGAVAQGLTSVQANFGKVEREVLNKVFDMETFKRFVSEHNYTMDLSVKLKAKIEKLEPQAHKLRAELLQVRQLTDEQWAKFQTTMLQLRDIDQQDQVQIDHLSEWLNWLKAIEMQVLNLQQANSGLKNDQLKATDYVQSTTAILDHEQALTKEEYEKSMERHGDITKQHQYAANCRILDHQLQAQLVGLEGMRQKQHQQAMQVNKLGVGRSAQLMKLNDALRGRAQKNKRNALTIKGETKNQRDEVAALQQEGQMKLAKMREVLGSLRQQSTSIESELMARETARQTVERSMGDAQAQVDSLQGAVLSGQMAHMKANNTRLHAQLAEMKAALASSQAAATAAAHQLFTAQQEEQVATAASQAATASAQAVAQQALAAVATAEQSGESQTSAAASSTMEAEASLTVDCKDLWDKNHTVLLAQLNGECSTVDQDLNMANALVASLSGTISAERQTEG